MNKRQVINQYPFKLNQINLQRLFAVFVEKILCFASLFIDLFMYSFIHLFLSIIRVISFSVSDNNILSLVIVISISVE